MKRNALIVALCLCGGMGAVASAETVQPNKQYPRFQVGVSGIWATIEPGLKVTVQDIQADTPAVGKLQTGDVIVSANGRSLAEADPRVPLGLALCDAEASGKLALKIKRGGADKDVTLAIPVIGAYGPTWPINDKKSETLVKQTASRLVKGQTADGLFAPDGQSMGTGLTGCMAALFLMSTGDAAYMPNVEKFAHAVALSAEQNPTDQRMARGLPAHADGRILPADRRPEGPAGDGGAVQAGPAGPDRRRVGP